MTAWIYMELIHCDDAHTDNGPRQERCRTCDDPEHTYRKWRRRAENMGIAKEYEHHIDTGLEPSAAYWQAHNQAHP